MQPKSCWCLLSHSWFLPDRATVWGRPSSSVKCGFMEKSYESHSFGSMKGVVLLPTLVVAFQGRVIGNLGSEALFPVLSGSVRCPVAFLWPFDLLLRLMYFPLVDCPWWVVHSQLTPQLTPQCLHSLNLLFTSVSTAPQRTAGARISAFTDSALFVARHIISRRNLSCWSPRWGFYFSFLVRRIVALARIREHLLRALLIAYTTVFIINP